VTFAESVRIKATYLALSDNEDICPTPKFASTFSGVNELSRGPLELNTTTLVYPVLFGL